jgi:hypothetical protein
VRRATLTLAVTERTRFALALAPLLGSTVACNGGSGLTGGDCPAGGVLSGNFNGECIHYGAGTASYSTSQATTAVLANTPDNDSGSGVTVRFPGDAPGTFSCGTEGGTSVVLLFNQPGASYTVTNDPTITPCTITVPHYGAVDAAIVGTFSGTLTALERSGNPLPPQQMVITDGAFSFVREADVP